MKKQVLAATLAVMMGMSVTMSERALAFGLGDVVSAVSGSPAAGNTPVDIDGLTSRQGRMLESLASSTLLLAWAADDVYQALELDPKIIGDQNLIYTNLSSDRTNNEYLKKASDHKVPVKEIKAAAKAALNSGDQEKINKINESIRNASLKRQGATIYSGLAIADAVSVIKEASAGMKGSDMASTLMGLVKSAQQAQSLCNAQHKQAQSTE